MDSDTTVITDGEFDTAQMYRDLVAAASNYMPTGAFTIRQFALDTGRTEGNARLYLMEQIAVGKLEGKKVALDGSQRWIFWFPERQNVSRSDKLNGPNGANSD